MSEKKIPKAKLDEAIKQARYYFDVNVPQDKKDVGAMFNAATAAYPKGFYAYVLSDLLSSILTHSGLKRDATNEDIYKVLEVLGWEVE